MRRAIAIAVAAVVACAIAAPASAEPAGNQASGQDSSRTTEYAVLYATDADRGDTRAAIEAAGGTVDEENEAIGLATVRSAKANFPAAVTEFDGVAGITRNRAIGKTPETTRKGRAGKSRDVEEQGRQRASGRSALEGEKPPSDEPLAPRQWDMEQIRATSDGSHGVERGKRNVRVGVIDTGIDGSHPDIAPNFDRRLSRNFTTDIPQDANGDEVDGPCEEEPDESCEDPADVDENQHGTHVASTIAAPLNGHGMAGVAPNVSLVNLRAGQDSGYFFLPAVIDALTYAGDVGIDVANMSFYVDPWKWNCTANEADSAFARLEQRTVRVAVQRALAYAQERGVTLVAAAGNDLVDSTKQHADDSSPNFAAWPGRESYDRTIDPACTSMPADAEETIPVSATGISERKSYYSTYGRGFVNIAAPGGDSYDTADNKADVTRAVLGAYPKALAEERGELDPDGKPNVPYVVRDCSGGQCSYYQYLQGTSMAAPHATGVAALIVSKHGPGQAGNGRGLDPRETEAKLRGTATRTACPSPRDYTYTRYIEQDDGSFEKEVDTHTCEGPKKGNGFFGDGIIDALRAVGGDRR